MQVLLVFIVVGLGAQLVDGALGMGFGITSTTLLLLTGVTAAQASFAVHLAQIGTNLASGISHWRFGNVDPRLVLKLAVPGAVGGFLGATVLARLSTEAAAPVTASILLVLGLFIMVRFSFAAASAVGRLKHSPHGIGFLSPLGLVGGFVDATGGGGWGPLTTSTLLTAGKVQPRRVIGSVSTSEFFVSLSVSLGFLLGMSDVLAEQAMIVIGLLVGGVLAAPFAAWLVSRVNPTLLGTVVGGALVLINSQRLVSEYSDSAGFSPGALSLYAAILVTTVALVVRTRRKAQPAGGTQPADDPRPGDDPQPADASQPAGGTQHADDPPPGGGGPESRDDPVPAAPAPRR